MTPDERERMAILCEQIAKEQDHEKFTALVQELSNLLEIKSTALRLRKNQSSPTTLCAVRLTFLAARTTTPLGVDFLFSARIVD